MKGLGGVSDDGLGSHESANGFAENGVSDAVGGHQIEDDDGHFVVHAEREGGGIHHLEAFCECLGVGDAVVTCCGGIFLGIRGVDAIDLGCLEDDFRSDFARAKRCGGIGREEGVTCAGDEDDDAALFEVAHGFSANEGFGHALDGNRGLDAGGDAEGFQLALQGHAVDDGGEHPHVVGGGSLHAFVAGGEASPDVAAADDHGCFDAHFMNFLNLSGDSGDDSGGDAFGGSAVFKGFSTHLENDAFVTGFAGIGGLVAHFRALSVRLSGEESRNRAS